MELAATTLASIMHPVFRRQSMNERLAATAPPNGARRGELHPVPRALELEPLLARLREAAMPHGPVCPRCDSRSAVRNGKRNGIQRYRCKPCRRCFTDLTGTVLEGLHKRHKFLHFCLCMIQGLSVRAAAREVGISKNTSFDWRHRMISVLADADSHTRLEGIIELAQKPLVISADGSRVSFGSPARMVRRDWPWLSPLYPGRDYNRHKRFLLFAVDRRGRVRAEIIGPHGSNTPGQAIRRLSKRGATVCARRPPGLWPSAVDYPEPISWVDGAGNRGLKTDLHPQDPLYHVANARSLVMTFRNWMRRFQVVATRYLLRYVSWFWRTADLSKANPQLAAKTLLFDVLRAAVHA
jgi:transposase-like protein